MGCNMHRKGDSHTWKGFPSQMGLFSYTESSANRLGAFSMRRIEGSRLAYRCDVEPHVDTVSPPGNASWNLTDGGDRTPRHSFISQMRKPQPREVDNSPRVPWPSIGLQLKAG